MIEYQFTVRISLYVTGDRSDQLPGTMNQEIDWMPAKRFEAIMQLEPVQETVPGKRVAGIT
jgi:hypothetical protein